MPGGAEVVLSVRDLRVHFFTDQGVVRAVDGVSLHVRSGETLALVGESGCGKTVAAGAVMRLHQGLGQGEADKKAIEMLELVRMPEASKRFHQYPHELSGA